jgi:RNase H-like domain found in reverse transcriptase/Reverse transcriptase (RNA-dependent DNA polymerase)/Integrase zinc binding domain/Chromo (CHRromatin Organisation MOdifier) domain
LVKQRWTENAQDDCFLVASLSVYNGQLQRTGRIHAQTYPEYWPVQPEQWHHELQAVRKRARWLRGDGTTENPDNLSDVVSDGNDEPPGAPRSQRYWDSPTAPGSFPADSASSPTQGKLQRSRSTSRALGPPIDSPNMPDPKLSPDAAARAEPVPPKTAYRTIAGDGRYDNRDDLPPHAAAGPSKPPKSTYSAPEYTSQDSTPTARMPAMPQTGPDWEVFFRALMTTARQSASPEPSALTSASWRIADVGYFWPDADTEKHGPGSLFTDKRDTCYRDFHIWWKNVATAASSDHAKDNVLRRELHHLFRGSALQWYHAQLSPAEQTRLQVDLTYWKAALDRRFGVKPEDASAWFHSEASRYTKNDNTSGRSVREYAMDVAKYARIWGDTSDFQILTRLYDGLHAKLRQVVDKPDQGSVLGAYLDKLEDKARFVSEELKEERKPPARATRSGNTYFQDGTYGSDNDDSDNANYNQDRRRYRDWRQGTNRRQRRPEGQAYRPRRDRSPGGQVYRSRRDGSPARDRLPARTEERQERDRSRQYRRRRGQRWARVRRRQDDQGYYYTNEVIVWDDEPNATQRADDLEQAGWTQVSPCETEEEVFPDDEDNDSEGWNFVDIVSHDKTQGDVFFQHRNHIHPHRRHPARNDRHSQPAPQPKDRVCRKCKAIFPDRTSLMDHVFGNSCVPPLPKTPALTSEGTRSTTGRLKDGQVVEAVVSPTSVDATVKPTYFRLPVKFDTAGDTHHVCADTGASTTLVSRSWLTRCAKKVRFEDVKPRSVNAVNSLFEVTEKATFDFYMPGRARDCDIFGHFTITADVILDLKPNLLMGMDFLHANGVKIDTSRGTATFRSVFNMTVQGEILRRPRNVEPARKVVATSSVTLRPREQAFLPVNFMDLPAPANDGDEDVYSFVPSAAGFIEATLNHATPKLLLACNTTDKPITFNTGQKLGSVIPSEEETANFITWDDAWNLLSDPKTEIGEGTFLAIPDKGAVKADEDIERPDPVAGDRVPSYGIEKPDKLPAKKSKFGVSVYDGGNNLTDKMIALLDRYDVYHDRGVIPMPEESKMKINLVDGWQNQKRATRSYPLSIQDMAVLDDKHDKLHAEGKMGWMDQPAPIACPLFVVWKQVGAAKKGRVVADLRPLNRLAIPDIYPLPDQDDIKSALRGKKYFCIFDGSTFFFQLPIYTPHRDRMVVISPRGLEVSNVVLMGFKNSPAFAQRFMDRIFFKHRHFVRAYIDDIVIFSDTAEEHLEHVEQVLRILDENRVCVSAAKSFAAYQAVRLLGYIVDGEGVSRTDDRVQAFRDMKFPATLDHLETYLGMAGYLRTGIPWFDVKSAALQARKTALNQELKTRYKPGAVSKAVRKARTSNLPFTPTKEELDSFQALQDNLVHDLKLYHHDPDRTLFFKLDRSKIAFGLFVFQLDPDWDGKQIPGRDTSLTNFKPILFMSKLASQVEQRYSSTEGEVAAVAWACRKLRKMVQSNRNPVQILTDHAATASIVTCTSLNTMDLNKANIKLAKAANYLSQFNLAVHYIPGALNVIPDALSRLPTLSTLATDVMADELDDIGDEEAVTYHTSETTMVTTLRKSLTQRLMKGYLKDSKWQRIIDVVKERPDRKLITGEAYPFELHNGLLYHVSSDGCRRLCVPKGMIGTLLTMVHDNLHHFGINKMLYELRAVHFYDKDAQVRSFIAHCAACRRNQTLRAKPPGEMLPIRGISRPYASIAMDFVVALPEAPSAETMWALPGYTKLDSFCTVSCRFCKKTILIAGHTTYKAKDWAYLLLRSLQLGDWGLPEEIVSDRDPKFTSDLWTAIHAQLNIGLRLSTAYHPQTDGLSERKNQTVEIALRYHTNSDNETPWPSLLPALQHNLNNSLSSVLGRTPNEVALGFKPRAPIDMVNVVPKNSNDAAAIAVIRKTYQEEAEVLIDTAAEIAKLRYDDKHSPVSYEIGDTVYLRLGKGYHLPGKRNRKLSSPREGPFTVVKKVGPLAYQLDFPSYWKVHPVVSVAQLYRPAQGPDPFGRPTLRPSQVATDGTRLWTMDALLDHRIITRRHRRVRQYLVRWEGYGAKDDTWEDRTSLLRTAKETVLEFDKIHSLQ